MSHEFFNPESEYQAFGRLNPGAYSERERVKREFQRKLEEMIQRVNKEVTDQYHVPDHIRKDLDEAAKDFFAKIPDRALTFFGQPHPFPEGHHGRWETLTVEDVKFLIKMRIGVD